MIEHVTFDSGESIRSQEFTRKLNEMADQANAGVKTITGGPGILVSQLGDQATISALPRSAASANPLILMLVKSILLDYLVCHTWDGATEGTDDIAVAKPFQLRHDKKWYVGSDGNPLTSFTTVNAQRATVVQGTTSETWQVNLRYFVNCEIHVMAANTLIEDVGLIDMNLDSRKFGVVA